MSKRIIISSVGTLGDLHPFIAIGLALKAEGHTPVMAVAHDHVDKCAAAGLEAHPVSETFEDTAARLGGEPEEIVRKMMSNVDYLFKQVVLPTLPKSTRQLERIAKDADCIFGSPLFFANEIIAEKLSIPYIAGYLQPSILLSPYEPPVSPQVKMAFKTPAGGFPLFWNRCLMGAAKTLAHLRYGPAINQVRKDHGLPASQSAPILDPQKAAAILGLYAPELGGLLPDAPDHMYVTGFALFDSESGAAETLDPGLEAFLDDGDPPLIFTLGSVAFFAGEAFYREAARLSRKLSRRAILLTGQEMDIPKNESVFTAHYAPHSLLFPRGSHIIHHGGVGTTTQALRAGVPQLIVPHLGDQWDNAERIKRRGVGDYIWKHPLKNGQLERKLTALIRDTDMHARAKAVSKHMIARDGAKAAAKRIIRSLGA